MGVALDIVLADPKGIHKNLIKISLCLGKIKPVANPRLGEEAGGMGGVRFDLLAKLIDEHAEILYLPAIIRPPHGLKKFSMGDGHIRIAGEVTKKVKFLGSQMHFLTVHSNPASNEIDHCWAQVQQIRCARTHERRPAKGRSNAS